MRGRGRLAGTRVVLDGAGGPRELSLSERIGRGHFSEVYRGEFGGQWVAVKVASSDVEAALLENEGRVLAALGGCRGICGLVLYQRDAGILGRVLLLELAGENLSQFRKRQFGGRLGLSPALKVGLEMIHGLEELHSRGFVHRDVKLANFAWQGSQCVLLDFGLAKEWMPLPRTNCPFRGTVKYASVNAHYGIEQSFRDDLYSFFITLYFLAFGDLPWIGVADRGEICRRKEEFLWGGQVCKDTMPQLRRLLDYIDSLAYHQRPDYAHIRRILMAESAR